LAKDGDGKRTQGFGAHSRAGEDGGEPRGRPRRHVGPGRTLIAQTVVPVIGVRRRRSKNAQARIGAESRPGLRERSASAREDSHRKRNFESALASGFRAMRLTAMMLATAASILRGELGL